MIYWICALFSWSTVSIPRELVSKFTAGAALLFFFLALSIWQYDDANFSAPAQPAPAMYSVDTVGKSFSPLIASSDLGEIKQRGRLRVLLQKKTASPARPLSTARRLIRQYGSEEGLYIDWIEVDEARQLFSYLRQGRGDIILRAGASFHQDMQSQTQLTLPWGISQQQVISRSDTGRIRKLEDLGTRQIAIKASSPILAQLQLLAKNTPAMDLVIIPETVIIKNILQRVASAQYDVTVLDNLAVEPYLPRFLNLEVAFNITEAKTVSWAVSNTAGELHASLNGFLDRQYLQSDITRRYQEDLPALQKKKLLRLITYQSPANYYLHRGKLQGFEHDLLRRFAESHQMRLDIVIADSHAELRELLLSGKGDVVAASVPRQSFDEYAQMSFSQTYAHAVPIVVGRSIDTPLLDIKALTGRRIILPAASPYEQVLQRIKARGTNLDIVIADVGESTETILFRVAQGMYDLTVVGGHELKARFARQINLRAHFALTEPLPHVWMVREADTQLLTALNDFISREFRKGFYNVLYSKYIDNPRTTLAEPQILAGIERLSPYDDIVHKYAEHYGFDWRLIVAQMYQESQFNPDAISYAGAEGLMQLIPATAELLGIVDTYDPDDSIQAGVRYMNYLRSKFDDNLLLEDRIWFSLAAYNAGYNRVQRARLLAERMNLDKNKWFDNVEKAMLTLARPYWKNGETARRCRCGQTVVYVRDIRTLYTNYVRLTSTVKTVFNRPELSQDI